MVVLTVVLISLRLSGTHSLNLLYACLQSDTVAFQRQRRKMAHNSIFIPATLGSKLKKMAITSIYVAALPPLCVGKSSLACHMRNISNGSTGSRSSSGSDRSNVRGGDDKTKRTNQWVIYFLTRDPETSVRLEFGRFGAKPSVLIVRSMKYVASNHVVKVFSLPTKEGTTVQTIYDVIRNSRCNRYYSANGSQGA